MPTQKEVIHLTLGTLSHHISTHFFNQQSSHFHYPDVGHDPEKDDERNDGSRPDELILDPGVDFQEGIGTRRNEQTFFPRQVVVDFRDSLGTRWDAYDVVFDDAVDEAEQQQGYGDEDEDDTVLKPSRAANEGLHAWSSPADVQRVGRDGKVRSTRLIPALDVYDNDDFDGEVASEDEEEHVKEKDELEQGEGARNVQEHRRNRVRASTQHTPAAYAHNPPHPRSLRPLPRLFGGGALVPMQVGREEGTAPLASFESGMALARYMEQDESIMDEQVRWFAEDSDALQSFSLCTSTADGFSGMAHEILHLLADEYPKTPVVAWGADYDVQAGQHPPAEDGSNARLTRLRLTNNILSLWSLSSASLYAPMTLPAEFLSSASSPKRRTNATEHVSSRTNWSDMYNLGGLYAAHIDTATLPSRLHDERLRRPTATLISTLNWRLDTPITSLGGCMPTPLLAPMAEAPKRILDPIEALLAARGYDPHKFDQRQREQNGMLSPQELASRAANRIQKAYISLAPASFKPQQQQHTPTARSRHHMSTRSYAQAAVARDDDRMASQPTRDAMEAWLSLDEPAGRTDVVPLSLRVRSATFPLLFRRLTSSGRPWPATEEQPQSKNKRCKIDTLPMLASLRTTPETAALLAEARQFVDTTLVKGHEPLAAFGLGGSRGRSGAGQAASDDTEGLLGGREGLMEVRERLEELLGAYEEGLPNSRQGGAGDANDGMGTDEEYEADAGSDWDIDDD